MCFKSILLVVSAFFLSAITVNANAFSTVNFTDNGSYTTDNVTHLDWLDLTQTAGMSYDQVSAELGPGGSLEGWQFATTAQVSTFFDDFGGDSNFYSGWSTQNDGLVRAILPLWGNLYCQSFGCTTGEGASLFFTAPVDSISGVTNRGQLYDLDNSSYSLAEDYVGIKQATTLTTYQYVDLASALVRVSSVPLPAATWLFGSGLLGLIGVARRKARS